MASTAPLKTRFLVNPLRQPAVGGTRSCGCPSIRLPGVVHRKKRLTVKAAVGELSADSTTYLFVGAATVALLGTALPVLFSRKDTCPECDGAGFVRKSGVTLRANAARKDQAQIVCLRCNGLGKLNQIDK